MSFKDYRDIMRQMEREMAQLSDDVFRGFFDIPVTGGRFWSPPIDIYESEDTLIIKAEIAGVRAEDLHVALSADDRLLTIGGMRKERHGERSGQVRCHQLEIYFGPFERTVPLPHSIAVDREKLTAAYRDGFLVVTLPKLADRRLPASRAIAITDGAEDDSEKLETEEMKEANPHA